MTTTPRRAPRAVMASMVAAALALTGLTACGGDSDDHPGALAIVVGGHANMPVPSLTATARSMVAAAVGHGDAVSIVDASARPQLQGTLQTASDCDSDTACQDIRRAATTRITAAIARVRAQVTQTDLLAATAIAARSLQDVRGPKRLLVVDSGVQTTGALPVTAPGVLDGDGSAAGAIAASLRRNGDLPDLRGVDVLLTGLGSTYAPQPAAPERVVKRLEALWRTVIGAATPASLHVDPAALPATAPVAGLPAVRVVDFTPRPPSCHGRLALRADQVGFVRDRAGFLDERKARSVLAPIARLLAAPGASATLTGTTAEPEVDPGSPKRLSILRAMAAKRLLVELGVPAGRLAVRGVGTRFAGFVADTDARGRLVEALAIQNRLVIVTSRTLQRTCGKA